MESQMSDLTIQSPADSSQSPFDSIRQTRPDGSEFWSARDLMEVEGYQRWEKFKTGLSRAMSTARNQGHSVENHFPRSGKKVEIGSGAEREVEDYELTRFAAYLVAMNGDPNMAKVAEAQAYFAVQTRVAETQKPALTGAELLAHAVLEAQQMLASKDKEIEALDAYVAELAPKAAYVDAFVTDSDVLRFSAVASTVGLKESELRDLLVEKKWIFVESATRWSQSKGKKVTIYRYSEYADKKPYFQRIQNHDVPRFRGEVMHTLKVTSQGAEAIARLVRRTRTVVDLFDGDIA